MVSLEKDARPPRVRRDTLFHRALRACSTGEKPAVDVDGVGFVRPGLAVAVAQELQPQHFGHALAAKAVALGVRLGDFLGLLVGDDDLIPFQQHVGIFPFGFEGGVVRVVPNRVREQAVIQRDAGDAIARFDFVANRHQASSHAAWSSAGKVTRQAPGSKPSTRAKPL